MFRVFDCGGSISMLKDFKKVIRECEYSNTYKIAWAKSIIELSNKYFDNANEYVELSLFDIALKMFKYYFDQTNFKIDKLWITEDKLNRNVKWLNVIINKEFNYG